MCPSTVRMAILEQGGDVGDRPDPAPCDASSACKFPPSTGELT